MVFEKNQDKVYDIITSTLNLIIKNITYLPYLTFVYEVLQFIVKKKSFEHAVVIIITLKPFNELY